MPLQGTFDVLDFAEVMRLLARQELTGRLHVRSRSFGANIFLDGGSLIGADQSEHQAAAAAGDVRGRLEEVCFELLDAERGTFEFQPGRPSALAPSTRLDVDGVLERAAARVREWKALQEALPSLEVQPRLADDLAAAQVTFDQERWRVLTVIDGRRNLRAIGRTLALSDFDVCRIVKGLIDDGVVELDPRSAALAAGGRDATVPTIPPPVVDAPTVPADADALAGETTDGPPASGEEGPVDPPPVGATDGIVIEVDDDGAAVPGPDAADPAAEDDAGPGGRKRRVVRIRSRNKPATT